MAKTPATYDLTLLLDSGASDDQRAKVLKDTEAAIAKKGEVIGTHDWGTRATTYEVRKKADAEYHLIQFHGTPELLADLNRTLRITDGVLRFRVIKLAPGVGEPPDLKSAPVVAPASEEQSEAPAAPRYDENVAPEDVEAPAEEPVAVAAEEPAADAE
jgi:small subunit ribosomal protein S6